MSTLKGKNLLPMEGITLKGKNNNLLLKERIYSPWRVYSKRKEKQSTLILKENNLLPRGDYSQRKEFTPYVEGYSKRKEFTPHICFDLLGGKVKIFPSLSSVRNSFIFSVGFPNFLGPVVQSVVSLTSSLRVISLTVLADSIYIILIFFAEKM